MAVFQALIKIYNIATFKFSPTLVQSNDLNSCKLFSLFIVGVLKLHFYTS